MYVHVYTRVFSSGQGVTYASVYFYVCALIL